jgi:hypothetical protein
MLTHRIKILCQACRKCWQNFHRSIVRYLGYRVDIVGISQKETEKKFFTSEATLIEELLEGKKLVHFDVGASGGIEKGLNQYMHLFEFIIAEPRHNTVVNQNDPSSVLVTELLDGKIGTGILNISEAEELSSTLSVNPYFANFWASGNLNRFRVKERKKFTTTTLEQSLDTTLSCCDYLKVDTQGTELKILKGLGRYRPIIIKSEISFVPLYRDQALFYELAMYLYELGYMLFHLSYRSKSVPEVARGRSPFRSTLLPVHGDAWFMPDWTQKLGQDIIIGREKEYRALMTIFCMSEIGIESLGYIERCQNKVP